MAEDINIIKGTKKEQYEQLLPQIKSLVSGETDLIANLGNACAALKEQFGWLWVGFYLIKNDELVLGPFQGPVACTRIAKGRGVCGTAWDKQEAIIVRDVDAFPGHIACSSASKSEIVIPYSKNGKIIGVLDVDSGYLDSFDKVDQHYLEEMLRYL